MIKRIYIEITNICNLNCSFCSSSRRHKHSMTSCEFEYIIKQIANYDFSPLPQLYLHVKGEPLLHIELEKILILCNDYGFKVNITTNGTLLKNVSEILLRNKSVRQVNISLHSFERNIATHNSKEVELQQTEYLGKITDFANDCKHQGTPIVAFRLWKCGSRNLDKSAEYSKNFIMERFGQGEYSKHSGKESIKLSNNIYLNFDTEFAWPSLCLPIVSEKGKCLGGREMLAVLADGTVTACCLDAEGVINLGNIFKSKLCDILATEKYLELVKGFSGGKISEEICKRCSYRQRFDKGD